MGGLGGCFIAETDSQGIMVSKSINEGTIGGCSKIGGIIGEIDSNMKTFEIISSMAILEIYLLQKEMQVELWEWHMWDGDFPKWIICITLGRYQEL